MAERRVRVRVMCFLVDPPLIVPFAQNSDCNIKSKSHPQQSNFNGYGSSSFFLSPPGSHLHLLLFLSHNQPSFQIPSFLNTKLSVAVGDKLPEATVSDLTKGKKAILFAVPGAFTPISSKKYIRRLSKGVDSIACISVDDAFVMKVWKDSLKVDDEVILLSDDNGSFTKAIGVRMVSLRSFSLSLVALRICSKLFEVSGYGFPFLPYSQ